VQFSQFPWKPFANIVRKCDITYSTTNVVSTKRTTCLFYQGSTKFIKWKISISIDRTQRICSMTTLITRPYALGLFFVGMSKTLCTLNLQQHVIIWLLEVLCLKIFHRR